MGRNIAHHKNLTYHRFHNLHALKQFLGSVPEKNISQIRKLKLRFGLSSINGLNRIEKYRPLGHRDDMKSLARAVTKRFTGITQIQLCLPAYAETFNRPTHRKSITLRNKTYALLRRDDYFHSKWRKLIRQETWASFVNMLLKHEKLERISAGFENEKLRMSLQHFLDNSHAAGRISIIHRTRKVMDKVN